MSEVQELLVALIMHSILLTSLPIGIPFISKKLIPPKEMGRRRERIPNGRSIG